MPHRVRVAVADLRREPVRGVQESPRDPLQESQLIYGEQVRVVEQKGEWLYIEALEQPCFKEKRWQGYPGWIEKNQIEEVPEDLAPNYTTKALWTTVGVVKVPFATRLYLANQPEEKAATPKEMIELGRQFLGFPYFWGGRSPYDPNYQGARTSVDCSGLVSLLYRACDIDVPRDAHDQFLWARSLAPTELREGDLIFLSKVENPKRMCHVMLYAGEGILLEATSDSGDVRLIAAEERLGKPLEVLPSGASNGKYHLFYGRVEQSISIKNN
jgi:gamma-D-glutamyl-L-lysine dipeptidyl-peptidase